MPVRRFASASIFLGAVAMVACTALPAAAQELIQPRPKDRLFPQGLFCPMPLDFPFVANGPTATIRFSTNVFFHSSNSGQLEWSEQSIDNITIAPQSVYDANLGLEGEYSELCYIGDDIAQRFYFQNAGAIPLKELFETDPAITGWDLANGAYWKLTPPGAPNDPGTETDRPAFSLGLGEDSATPSLEDSAFTSLAVSGLVKGQAYVLSGWWNVQYMDENELTLTVRIYGSGTTPADRRTWGVLKRRYDGRSVTTSH